MLAGLTGLVSGDRTVEPRQVEQAIAAAAVAEAAPSTRAVALSPTQAAALPRLAASPFPPAADAPRPSLARVDERRLE